MNPENTDCHTITSEDKTASALIEDLESGSFRFTQRLKISRYREPRSLDYFSCDGETGYLIAWLDEENAMVYSDIPKAEWDRILEAGDILEYYASFKKEYKPLTFE